MKKKILSILLSAVMAFSAVSSVAFADGMKPGTYTKTVKGMFDGLTVEVTLSEQSIEDVKVVSHHETAPGFPAIEKMPARIVESQSIGVDTVSGATFTSKGILEAVAACLTEAGADAESWKQAKAVEVMAKEQKTLEADLVVVGGGGSGMTAAIRAEELGLKVILLEKMPFLGGAFSISGGNQVVMGSQLQKDAGVTDDSVESMYNDFMANGANLNVPELLALYAENVGETSDWLHGRGVTYNVAGGLHQLAEYAHNRELAYTGGGAGAANAMKEVLASTSVEVMTDTRGVGLLTDETGAVVGVRASGENVDYEIRAKAVILATGGYGYNKDLQNEEMRSALYYGPVSSTGDGVLMATADGIDAATRLMEYGKRYPNGVEVSEGIAKSTIAGNIVGWTMSAILVNSDGNRVVNEKASNRTILETELEQPGQMLYLLMDEATFSVWKTKLAAAGIGEQDIDRYLAANGSSKPVFAHGATLEEAAAVVGMDAEALKKTVETYNGYVKSGVDAEFGRSADYMKMEIGEGPYYLVEQKPRFATTMGGLVINTGLEVENTSGAVIKGLYACGEVVGGVMGDDSPSGANNGWAVTSGKLAAESVAAALK